MAFDIEGRYRRGDGYFTDVTSGDDDVGKYENWSVRTGMKADFGDAGSLLLRYEHSSMNDPSTLMYNAFVDDGSAHFFRSEEHTSELQSLMRISYAVFCLKQKQAKINHESRKIYPLHNLRR